MSRLDHPAVRRVQAALREEVRFPAGGFCFGHLRRYLGVADGSEKEPQRCLAHLVTGAQGIVQEVGGLGVVGAQPFLQPGERFEYTSGASIATPVGTMRGSYQMVAADGTRFEAPIPEFTLSVPRVLH